MAVTIPELAVALRLSGDGINLPAPQTAILTRLMAASVAYVEKIVPDAPDAIKDMAIIRHTTYMYDQPVSTRDAYADAWVNSGAGSLAAPYR